MEKKRINYCEKNSKENDLLNIIKNDEKYSNNIKREIKKQSM